MKNKQMVVISFLAVAIMLFITPVVYADTVLGSSGGGWQSWTEGDINQNGTPYWDGNSSDYGTSGNIGNYLTNTGAFTGGSGPGVAYEYWGMADGSADAFGFEWLFGSSHAALRLEVAGYSNQNIFGYENALTGVRTELFNGAASAGASTTFTPTGDYVFYLTSPAGTFTTDMHDEGYDGAYQHFAIFKESEGVFWIGMEDLKSNSDYDYNDMIVKITYVPEPTTMLLLGFGLLSLVGIRRKLKK